MTMFSAIAMQQTLDMPCESTEKAAERAILVYKDAKAAAADVVKPYEDVMANAKAVLTDIIAETGKMTWKVAAGQAFVPAAGMTVSYDAKALDALCASSPELKAILWPHRFEKERAGSLTIR